MSRYGQFSETYKVSLNGTYKEQQGRIRWASSAVGNVVAGANLGLGVDFPEIVTAGWVDVKTTAGMSMKKRFGVHITELSGLTEKNGTYVGTYQERTVLGTSESTIKSAGSDGVSAHMKDGFTTDWTRHEKLAVSTLAYKGTAAASALMLGDTVKSMGLDKKHVVPYFGVKEAVLPFDKFPEVDPVLGPEMRSTGEVLGLADNFGLAYFKSQEAAGAPLPTKPGRVLVSLTQKQADIESAVKKLVDLGFTILATEGTANWLRDLGIPAYPVAKIGEGRPDCLDVIKNREVSLVINTPSVKANSIEHLGRIRKACIKYKVPYLTTIAAAYAAAEGIEAAMNGKGDVKSLQEYHATIS